MPRFFFDHGDTASIRDDVGVEYPNVHAAREAAMQTLPAIMRDEVDGREVQQVSMVVRNQVGQPVVTLTLTLQSHLLIGEGS